MEEMVPRAHTFVEAVLTVACGYLIMTFRAHEKRHERIDDLLNDIQVAAAKSPSKEDFNRLYDKLEELKNLVYMSMTQTQKDRHDKQSHSD